MKRIDLITPTGVKLILVEMSENGNGISLCSCKRSKDSDTEYFVSETLTWKGEPFSVCSSDSVKLEIGNYEAIGLLSFLKDHDCNKYVDNIITMVGYHCPRSNNSNVVILWMDYSQRTQGFMDSKKSFQSWLMKEGYVFDKDSGEEYIDLNRTLLIEQISA